MFRLTLALVIIISGISGLLTPEKNRWKTAHDNQISILTNYNFDSFLKDNRYAFVRFFTPWCGYCKLMLPEYQALARSMIENPDGIPIAQVDCTIETKTCNKEDITGYPVLRLYIYGEYITYRGQRTKSGITEFIERRTKKQATEIKTLEQMETIRKSKNSIVLTMDQINFEQIKIFNSASAFFEDEQFFFLIKSTFEDNIPEGNPDEKINILFFKGDEVANLSSENIINMKTLKSFLITAEQPTVFEGDSEVVNDIYHNSKNVMFMFYDDSHSPAIKIFTEFARIHHGVIQFVKINFKESIFENLFWHVGVNTAEHVSIMILEFADKVPTRYKLEQPLDKDSLSKFFLGYMRKEIKPFYRSEPSPVENDSVVKVVVGSTFNKMVIKSQQTVFLKVFSPSCQYSKALAPIFEKMASDFKSSKLITFAEYNGRDNDCADLPVRAYPDLLLYIAGKKSDKITYEGDRSYESIQKFLVENLGDSFLEDKLESSESDTETL